MCEYRILLKYENDRSHLQQAKSRWKGLNNLKVYGYHLSCFDSISSTDNEIEKIVRCLSTTHCSFGVVYEGNKSVWIAADSIGSVPLYYSLYKGVYYFTDDANYLAKEIGAEIDSGRLEEFRACSYVSGNNTLYKEVYQVLPGEIIYLDLQNETFQKTKYFEYAYNPQMSPESVMVEKYDEVLLFAFEELKKRLGGRQVLIPLSGGLDSRTVAVMLKRVGYENVLCFSYGRKGNYETEISGKVSKKLNYDWVYEEYTGDTWKDFYKSTDYTAFVKFSGRGSDIGCIQAVPAILSIMNKGIAACDSVVVPGHTLDVLCGSHLVKLRNREIKKRKLISDIKERHYSLCKNPQNTPFEKYWDSKFPDYMNTEEYVNLYQQWEYYNRQPKFIANDVRAYEYAGYYYDLPCWDIDIIQYWMSIPYEYLFGRKLQRIHVMKKINPICGIDKNEFEEASKKFIKSLIPKPIMDLRKKRRIWNSQYDYCDAFYDYMSTDEFHNCLRKYGLGFTVDTFVIEKTLGEL